MRLNLIYRMLSHRARGGGFLNWLLFVVLLLITIPLMLLMVILVPLLLIFSMLKQRFFPSKKSRVMMTPMGLSVYTPVERRMHNLTWSDIRKVEIWSENEEVYPVILTDNEQPIRLKGVSQTQLEQICRRHQVDFYPDVVIIQEA